VDFAIPLVCFIFGLVVGTLASRFGIGGAIVAIPFFRIILGFSGRAAIATALPLTIPTALSGAVVFHKKRLIKYKTAITAGVFGSIFSVIGAYVTMFVSSDFLMVLTSFMFFGLAYMISREKRERVRVTPSSLFEKAVLSIFIGCVAGFFSGFLGIGGGVILVPLLVSIRKIPLRRAIPTSLATMAIYAVPGAITHYMLGNVNIDILTFVLLGSVIGARISAEKTAKVEEKHLKDMFVVLLVFLGGILLVYELFVLAGII
jgi:uncharacterized membrane protein YfcA